MFVAPPLYGTEWGSDGANLVDAPLCGVERSNVDNCLKQYVKKSKIDVDFKSRGLNLKNAKVAKWLAI